MDETVRQLTTAVASGDTEAFARFYARWFDFMYVEARRTTKRDEAFCLDVVQDAMLRTIRSLRPLETEAQLVTWLRRTVRSCAIDTIRGEARRAHRQRATGRADTSEAGARETERLAWLREELDELDAGAVHLLTMRHRFGWTLHKIGATLGLTPPAVHRRFARIYIRLRERAWEQLGE